MAGKWIEKMKAGNDALSNKSTIALSKLKLGNATGISAPNGLLAQVQSKYLGNTPEWLQDALTNVLKVGNIMGLNDPSSAYAGSAHNAGMLIKGAFGAERAAAKSEVMLRNLADMLPKGAVKKVALVNANVAGHGIGSGEAFLSGDGRILLDGQLFDVGDSAYLFKEKFYKEPPHQLIEQIKKDHKPYIEMLTEESQKINRNAMVPMKKGEGGFFGGDYPDYSTRYGALGGNVENNKITLGKKIDSIAKKHDPESIEKAVIAEELDKHRFEIGNYLHVLDESPLTDAQKYAIESYRSKGGALGKTILDLLGESIGR